MASVATWSTTAASNTSVGGISTDGNVTLVNQIDNMFRGQMAEVATSRDDGTIINVYPRGHLHGLTLSNNAGDATNDIDIAAGECVTLDSPYWRMALASALTKRLDAAWAVGTGNGGLDTGSIANTTYHIWLIARSDTGVVDALFSTSATSPTMPTNYDRKRRIGSIMRVSAAIRPFKQKGNLFLWDAIAALDINVGNPGTAAALRTLSVPAGIEVEALVRILVVNNGAAATCSVYLNYPLSTSETADDTLGRYTIGPVANASGRPRALEGDTRIFTNTSSQIRSRLSFSDVDCFLNLTAYGWVDDRGKSF